MEEDENRSRAARLDRGKTGAQPRDAVSIELNAAVKNKPVLMNPGVACFIDAPFNNSQKTKKEAKPISTSIIDSDTKKDNMDPGVACYIDVSFNISQKPKKEPKPHNTSIIDSDTKNDNIAR